MNLASPFIDSSEVACKSFKIFIHDLKIKQHLSLLQSE